jgi:hypothetical protein
MPEQECHARAQGAVLWEAAIVGNVALLRRMIAGEALPVDLLPVTFRAGERIDMLSGKVINVPCGWHVAFFDNFTVNATTTTPMLR